MMRIRMKWLVPLLIFLTALILRIPNIKYPNEALFDEIIYENYALRYLHHQPYFDVHPPLAVMIMAGLANNNKTIMRNPFVEKLKSFGDFPYEKVRMAIAISGALIPVSVYFIVKKLYKPGWCTIAAVMPAVFDNALIVYSRYMFPDIILLSLGFGGTAMILESESIKNRYVSGLLFLAGCILLGGAISVKWTALCFVAFVLLIELFKKNYKSILILVLVLILTHLSVWLIFFKNFGNNTQPVYYPLERFYRKIVYPDGNDTAAVLKYLPTQFKDMFLVNKVFVKLEGASPPLFWPVGGGKFGLYIGANSKISFQVNYPAWFTALAAVIAGIILISLPPRKYEKTSGNIIKQNFLGFLVFGYLISYVPLFFVGRIMFLYHYLTPVVFGYMLIPALLGMVKYKFIRWLYPILILGGFIFISPVTYGFAVPNWWMNWIALKTCVYINHTSQLFCL